MRWICITLTVMVGAILIPSQGTTQTERVTYQCKLNEGRQGALQVGAAPIFQSDKFGADIVFEVGPKPNEGRIIGFGPRATVIRGDVATSFMVDTPYGGVIVATIQHGSKARSPLSGTVPAVMSRHMALLLDNGSVRASQYFGDCFVVL
jgi:hypothetical protein